MSTRVFCFKFNTIVKSVATPDIDTRIQKMKINLKKLIVAAGDQNYDDSFDTLIRILNFGSGKYLTTMFVLVLC